jgi:hypothetical protein
MTDTLTGILWMAGPAFALLAAVGVLRMPDVFTRMQASTKASTLGLGCLLIGAALQFGDFGSFHPSRQHRRMHPAHYFCGGPCHRTCVVSRGCAALGRHRARRAPA